MFQSTIARHAAHRWAASVPSNQPQTSLIYSGRSRDEGKLVKNPDWLEDYVSKTSCDFLPQNLQQLQPGGLAIKSQDNHDGQVVPPSCFYQGIGKEKASFLSALSSH